MAKKRSQMMPLLLIAGAALAFMLWPKRAPAAPVPQKRPFDPGLDVRIPTMERDPAADAGIVPWSPPAETLFWARQDIDLRRRGK